MASCWLKVPETGDLGKQDIARHGDSMKFAFRTGSLVLLMLVLVTSCAKAPPSVPSPCIRVEHGKKPTARNSALQSGGPSRIIMPTGVKRKGLRMVDIDKVFKAYEVRGIYGEDITEDLAWKTGFTGWPR